MAVAMVAMLAFGGTYAYFTAKATGTEAHFKTGYVGLTATATPNGTVDQTTSKILGVMPGTSLINSANVTVRTTETEGNYVAFQIAITMPKLNAEAAAKVSLDLELAKNGGSDTWVLYSETSADGTDTTTKTYMYIAGTKSQDVYSASKLVAGEYNTLAAVNFDATDYTEDGGAADIASHYGLMNMAIDITYSARSIQSTGITDANAPALLAAAFTNIEQPQA